MYIKFLVLLTILASGQCLNLKMPQDPLSDDFIEWVQSKASTWTAGRNFHKDTSINYLKRLMGFTPLRHSDTDRHYTNLHKGHSMPEGYVLPESFDAREKWPICPTIKEIMDQGSCGSCWAVSSVTVMSDRTCTMSDGKVNFHYSAEDLISCCHSCGNGCEGGVPLNAFSYWVNHGLVSGGNYNSSEGCVPYEIPPCKPHCQSEYDPTPGCKRVCESNYPVSYEKDLHYGEDSYEIDVKNAEYELFLNGPINACFMVYTDFVTYKSGVYQATPRSDMLGGHAIRVIGYGVENGIPYWLCANSWGSDWGDNGLFKIRRGNDECGIESDITAGTPEL